MTLLGNVGRWHGQMTPERLGQERREAERAIVRLAMEINDRRQLLAAHKEHLARVKRALAKMEAARGEA